MGDREEFEADVQTILTESRMISDQKGNPGKLQKEYRRVLGKLLEEKKTVLDLKDKQRRLKAKLDKLNEKLRDMKGDRDTHRRQATMLQKRILIMQRSYRGELAMIQGLSPHAFITEVKLFGEERDMEMERLRERNRFLEDFLQVKEDVNARLVMMLARARKGQATGPFMMVKAGDPTGGFSFDPLVDEANAPTLRLGSVADLEEEAAPAEEPQKKGKEKKGGGTDEPKVEPDVDKPVAPPEAAEEEKPVEPREGANGDEEGKGGDMKEADEKVAAATNKTA